MKSLIQCSVCEKIRVNYQAFSNLSLPIPNSNTLLLPVIIHQIPSEIGAIIRKQMNAVLQQYMNEGGEDVNLDGADQPSLHRGHSIAVIEKADEFVTQQSRRERPILINLAIDQGSTVKTLLETISDLKSINFVGKVKVGM